MSYLPGADNDIHYQRTDDAYISPSETTIQGFLPAFSLRFSESMIAIACLRFFTLGPDLDPL